MIRRLALACLTFVAAAWPNDLAAIHSALPHDWRLALGLSIKTATGLLSVLGLWQDKTYGYTFLLASSLQCLLVSFGSLGAVDFDFGHYGWQLVWPTLEGLFRVGCLIFLAVFWRRMFGEGR